MILFHALNVQVGECTFEILILLFKLPELKSLHHLPRDNHLPEKVSHSLLRFSWEDESFRVEILAAGLNQGRLRRYYAT